MSVGIVVAVFFLFKILTFFGVVLGLWKKIRNSNKRIAELQDQRQKLEDELRTIKSCLGEEPSARRTVEERVIPRLMWGRNDMLTADAKMTESFRAMRDLSVRQLRILRDIHRQQNTLKVDAFQKVSGHSREEI